MRIDVDVARAAARLVATVRIAIGVGALLSPRRGARVLFRDPPPAGAAALMRMFGGREVALALGTVLAARRDPAALRGWVEAGGLTDAGDVAALLADRGEGIRSLVRWPALGGATCATLAAVVVSRSLTGPSPAPRTAARSPRRSSG